jgi:hypothetical protein
MMAIARTLKCWHISFAPSTRFVVLVPAAILLARRVYEAVVEQTSLSGWEALHALHLDAFQLLAWGVAFYLLGQLRSGRGPSNLEIAGAIIVCSAGAYNSSVGLIALSSFLFVTAGTDVRQRAVATVLTAIFVHQAIIPILYPLLVPTLTQFDATLVGALVKLTISGATWQSNVIAVPSGHAIQIMEACCSFHNVSMALLTWIALTKLERPEWRRLDIAVMSAAAGCQILMNTMRIYLMAQSLDMYLYWHNGVGAQIYSACASISAVLISAYGARLVSSCGTASRAPVRVQIS